VRQRLHGGRRCWLSCQTVVEEPQLQQAGVPAKRAEVGQQASAVAGGLQREAAQRRKPASTGNPVNTSTACFLMCVWPYCL